ncbi:hypothetical protein PHYPSEUDO_010222 [Phytophthora pseudosyringae]|uniref:Uncharacterized protein n=1 Tax=Phytophthora pseudosyringae TaxID=221518 RepID=A0A8T1VDR3_9STRA|nr:hypothetical protein PHYPSEUDO_010222 [Phytophthora pseudosyringae]
MRQLVSFVEQDFSSAWKALSTISHHAVGTPCPIKPSNLTKIVIIFYYTFGYVSAIPGVQAELYQVKETLERLHAPPKPDLPVATPDTRTGFSSVFRPDEGSLRHMCSASQGGGQETTAMSTTPFIAHHGMVFVPVGFRSSIMDSNDKMHGGSLWGAGTIANIDKSRHPSALELEIARIQGVSFAEITKKLSL